MDARLVDALAAGERAGGGCVLLPPRRAPGGTAGLLLTRHSGNSIDFREHREYHPGDDVRRIDWNVYARSDSLMVRMHHEEMSPHADIVVDLSRSMALGGTRKAEAALGLVAMLAEAASNGGFSRSVWAAGDEVRRIETNGPAANWQGLAFDGLGSPAAALASAQPAWKPFGMRIFVSDLLWLGDPGQLVRQLAHRAAAVVIVQLLAARDLAPERAGNARLVDSESGETLDALVDDAALERYASALRRHQENWSDEARRGEAVMLTMTAEEVVDGWRVAPLAERGIVERRRTA
jgi:uncharacterized protein (DUF58 family)